MKISTLTRLFCLGSLAAVVPMFAAEPSVGETAGVSKVAHIKGMDKLPVALKQVAPTYPLELRGRGVQGFATVDMLIDSTGRVVSAKAVRSTNPAFAREAVEAAEVWTFQPAEADGHAITSRVQVPFRFEMPEIVALERKH